MKTKKIISIALVILGLILITLPVYNDYRLKENMKKSAIDDITAQDLADNNKKVLKDDAFDFSKVDEITPTSTFLNANQIDKSLLIGQVVIPSVNMNLSVFKGSTNENLLAGATTMKKDDIMGKDNFTLAGHYNKDKSILFGSLMDVKVGDIIKVTDKNTIYEYKVYANKVVDDRALYMIKNDESKKRGNSIISMMTCYHSSKTGKRYFVLGDLVKTYPYQKELMQANTKQK